MKAGFQALRRGFTLVELMVAMAITAVLVTIIMGLTNQGIVLWHAVQQDVSTSARARVALQTIAHDLESFQMNGNGNKYQWMASEVVRKNKDKGKVATELDIPESVSAVFFACAPDRNPAVSSNNSLRAQYREERDGNPETQGDVNAVAYRLLYRDHILGKEASGREDGSFPVFALYRHVVEPRIAFDNLMCCENGKLMSAYNSCKKKDRSKEDDHFLCENILEMSITFNIQYLDEKSQTKKGEAPKYISEAVNVISSNGGSKRFDVYGDRIEVEGKSYPYARIVSAEISMTVLTEDGVNLVEQIRLGYARPPHRETFYSRYTRSFSRTVLIPQPM